MARAAPTDPLGASGVSWIAARSVGADEMSEQEAREFVEMLAVPDAPAPPPCPLCGRGHPLETSCALSTERGREVAGLRE